MVNHWEEHWDTQVLQEMAPDAKKKFLLLNTTLNATKYNTNNIIIQKSISFISKISIKYSKKNLSEYIVAKLKKLIKLKIN